MGEYHEFLTPCHSVLSHPVAANLEMRFRPGELYEQSFKIVVIECKRIRKECFRISFFIGEPAREYSGIHCHCSFAESFVQSVIEGKLAEQGRVVQAF